MFLRPKTIIASLGLLNEDVNATPFIQAMLDRAAANNSEFQQIQKITEVKKAAFVLSEQFNRGEIEPEEFKAQLLTLLGGIAIDSKDFWEEWNAMIKPGKIASSIRETKFVVGSNNLLCLYSDTNTKHIQALALAYAKEYIYFNLETSPPKLEELETYLSFREKTNRLGLIEKIYNKLQAKVVRPSEITLIAGNPDNIIDDIQRMLAHAALEKMTVWCREKNVKIVLHDKTNKLEDTIKNILSPKPAAEPEPQSQGLNHKG